MAKKPKQTKGIERRNFLPFLGTGLLLSLLPTSMRASDKSEEKEEYQTLLKPDGTTVRVKTSKIKKSKKVRKNLSNSELLRWLDNNKDRS